MNWVPGTIGKYGFVMLVGSWKFCGLKSLSLGGRLLSADGLTVGTGVATVTELPAGGVVPCAAQAEPITAIVRHIPVIRRAPWCVTVILSAASRNSRQGDP
jgi:hypothetical protein